MARLCEGHRRQSRLAWRAKSMPTAATPHRPHAPQHPQESEGTGRRRAGRGRAHRVRTAEEVPRTPASPRPQNQSAVHTGANPRAAPAAMPHASRLRECAGISGTRPGNSNCRGPKGPRGLPFSRDGIFQPAWGNLLFPQWCARASPSRAWCRILLVCLGHFRARAALARKGSALKQKSGTSGEFDPSTSLPTPTPTPTPPRTHHHTPPPPPPPPTRGDFHRLKSLVD